ncbi:hypothetical protein LMTR3_32865 [Bradyrhizobium sp. LMTR 3]|nr:hypothetical protein LMTR3_32865 [Bradyrhizobium sp. LMTR 3]
MTDGGCIRAFMVRDGALRLLTMRGNKQRLADTDLSPLMVRRPAQRVVSNHAGPQRIGIEFMT